MPIEVEVITGRTIDQGKTVEEKLSEEYFKAVSYCELSKEDFEALGLAEGDRVKIKSDFGEVVVFARIGDLPRGIIFIPMGPYANAVISEDTDGTGMPRFKGVRAVVDKTDEEVRRVEDLI
jgi:formylmethanofuran dehydrogenase subunit D